MNADGGYLNSVYLLSGTSYWLSIVVAISTIALIIFLLFGCYLLQSGIINKIIVETKESPYDEMTVAYKTGRGPYKGASTICSEVLSIIDKKAKESQTKSGNGDNVDRINPLVIGLYYDDPESVPEDELRFAVGAVLSKGMESSDPNMLENMISHGYKIAVFPKPAFVVTAAFPLKTRLSLYIAIFRVYPRLRDYINAKGLCAYPAMEFYTEDNIQFVMPLSKQEEFFVPEFSEEQVSIATTEFSTHAPSEANKSWAAGMDETGSVSGAGSIHGDSQLNFSSTSNIRHTPDKRVKEDFGGESESEDITTEEDEGEEQDQVFVKPTKPAPRKKLATKISSPPVESSFLKQQDLIELSGPEPQNESCFNESGETQDPALDEINGKKASQFDISSTSESSSFEDLTKP